MYQSTVVVTKDYIHVLQQVQDLYEMILGRRLKQRYLSHLDHDPLDRRLDFFDPQVDEASCMNSIESVRKTSPTAEVVEVDK